MWKRGDLCDVLITDWDSVGFQGKWYLGVYLATAGALHVVAYDYNGWRVSYSIEDCRIRPVPDATPIRIITMDHQDQDIPDDYASQGEQKPLTPPELVGTANRDAIPWTPPAPVVSRTLPAGEIDVDPDGDTDH